MGHVRTSQCVSGSLLSPAQPQPCHQPSCPKNSLPQSWKAARSRPPWRTLRLGAPGPPTPGVLATVEN